MGFWVAAMATKSTSECPVIPVVALCIQTQSITKLITVLICNGFDNK